MVQSITSFADLQNAELREEEAALRRQLDRMTEAHNQLSEDCARLDNELQDTQDVKHRVTEYQTENTRLQATVGCCSQKTRRGGGERAG